MKFGSAGGVQWRAASDPCLPATKGPAPSEGSTIAWGAKFAGGIAKSKPLLSGKVLFFSHPPLFDDALGAADVFDHEAEDPVAEKKARELAEKEREAMEEHGKWFAERMQLVQRHLDQYKTVDRF